MAIDDKTILDLASQLGISTDKRAAMEKVKSMEKKSDSELVSEIMKIKDKLNDSNIPYDKQIAAVQSLMPMMNEEQKARLSKIIGLIRP